MKKYKKNLMLLSLLTMLLSGCGKTNTKIIEETEEISEETNQLSFGEQLFGYRDYSKYDFFDETMLIGLNIIDIEDETYNKHIMVKTFKAYLDKKEYGKTQEFLKNAKDAAIGYLTDEEIEKSNIIVTLARYKGIDGVTTYQEKRTVFEIPRDGEIEILAINNRIFINIEKETAVAVQNFSSNRGIDFCVGTIYIKGEFYDLSEEGAKLSLNTFNIPAGIYTKDDLFKLLESDETRKLELK
ncbi:MAG: hypothetical protein HFI09_00990 [Bacilli bacterium]|nr:hypothetical protein [Bacilli bacterium]